MSQEEDESGLDNVSRTTKNAAMGQVLDRQSGVDCCDDVVLFDDNGQSLCMGRCGVRDDRFAVGDTFRGT